MPRLEVHEGANEVETVGCDKGDDDVAECRIRLDQTRSVDDKLSAQVSGTGSTHFGRSAHPAAVWGTAR